ncbi:MAG: hypothetical protein WC878_07535 [Candidatus Paceibacterota bacterium]|jgi:hypothetical protein
MKWLKICAVTFALLFGASAFHAEAGVCPTQETTVFFVNGVDVPKLDAKAHKEALSQLIYAKGISRDCVHFELAHVKDNLFTA